MLFWFVSDMKYIPFKCRDVMIYQNINVSTSIYVLMMHYGSLILCIVIYIQEERDFLHVK